jgi:transposase
LTPFHRAWLESSREDEGVLNVEDWAEVRRLRRAEGLPIKVIARVMGISKNTVKTALASDGPPVYRRRSGGSIVDAVEPQVRELLRVFPTMPSTVIAERLDSGDHGAQGQGRRAASGLLAAGSGEPHQLRRR